MTAKQEKQFIITSSDQISSELLDADFTIFEMAEELANLIISQGLKKQTKDDLLTAKILKSQIERRWRLVSAMDVIDEFECTVPKSENFTKVTEAQLRKGGLLK